MFVITMYFEGPKEDWYCQSGHPRKINNLLTYLLAYLLILPQKTSCLGKGNAYQ